MKKNLKRNKKGQFVRHNSEYSFVNLSTYTSPEIVEVNNRDWVDYGADNNYFQFLIDRYNGSPTNNAAINGISQAIYGKGLNATDSNRKPNEYAQMISLFKKDVVRKLCYDLKLMVLIGLNTGLIIIIFNSLSIGIMVHLQTMLL